jgi:predicted DNA-binding transcriptional regulator YafY
MAVSSLRGPQIWRLQHLIEWLKSGRKLTTRVAAERFEVSQRTIATDIGHLRQLGVPIEYDPSRFTYVLREPFDSLPLNVLTRADYAALLVARHALEALGDSVDARVLEQVTERLAEALPEDLCAEAREGAAVLKMDTGPTGHLDDEMLESLRTAARDQRVVRMAYYSASRDETSERDVEPLAVLHSDGSWYVVGRCRLRDGYRDFRIDRIRSVDATDEYFARPLGFDIQAYCSESFGMHRGERKYAVRIRFSAYQSRWIREKVWHESEIKLQRADGGIDLLLHAAGLADVQRWVLQYGSEAEVLGPPILRRRIAGEVRRMAEMYGGEPGVHRFGTTSPNH